MIWVIPIFSSYLPTSRDKFLEGIWIAGTQRCQSALSTQLLLLILQLGSHTPVKVGDT